MQTHVVDFSRHVGERLNAGRGHHNVVLQPNACSIHRKVSVTSVSQDSGQTGVELRSYLASYVPSHGCPKSSRMFSCAA